jgi:tRNA threonylcarbamoyladenosine biosynthesis protein TsaB
MVNMKKSLKRLVIDSATKYLYVALFEDFTCLGKYYKQGENNHSVMLMPEIENLLTTHNVKVKDIDEIYIGIGPGSYTGLRVGVVIAKMFAWDLDIPVFTVSSLGLMASSFNGEGLVLAEIDARRGISFLGLYDICNGYITLQDQEKLTNLLEYKSSISNNFNVVSFGEPNMEMIIKSKLFSHVEDIHSLNPNYLRMTEAERNLQ